jgi:hypothetical protein
MNTRDRFKNGYSPFEQRLARLEAASTTGNGSVINKALDAMEKHLVMLAKNLAPEDQPASDDPMTDGQPEGQAEGEPTAQPKKSKCPFVALKNKFCGTTK